MKCDDEIVENDEMNGDGLYYEYYEMYYVFVFMIDSEKYFGFKLMLEYCSFMCRMEGVFGTAPMGINKTLKCCSAVIKINI